MTAYRPREEIEAPARKRPHGKQEYKGHGKHVWEDIPTGYPFTKRLRVPGGWLYNTYDTIVFVPVPNAVGYAV